MHLHCNIVLVVQIQFWLLAYSFFSSTFKASSIASSNSLLSDLCFRYSFLEVTGILVTVFVLT